MVTVVAVAAPWIAVVVVVGVVGDVILGAGTVAPEVVGKIKEPSGVE